MLNRFDICCLFDSEFTDSGGLRRTKDRSRHGIHPLVGDGSTAGTMPTWDASRGLYTFDGGDSLKIRHADDSGDVLANMGSIQDEVYCMLLDPSYVSDVNLYTYLFHKNVVTAGQGSIWLIMDKTFYRYTWYLYVGAVATETLSSPADSSLAQNGKLTLVTFQRLYPSGLKLYIGDTLLWSDTDTLRDGSNNGDMYIGARTGTQYFLPAGTGMRFFGYGRFVATPTYLRQLTRFFRGVL